MAAFISFLGNANLQNKIVFNANIINAMIIS